MLDSRCRNGHSCQSLGALPAALCISISNISASRLGQRAWSTVRVVGPSAPKRPVAGRADARLDLISSIALVSMALAFEKPAIALRRGISDLIGVIPNTTGAEISPIQGISSHAVTVTEVAPAERERIEAIASRGRRPMHAREAGVQHRSAIESSLSPRPALETLCQRGRGGLRRRDPNTGRPTR